MKIKYLIILGFIVLANNVNAQEIPNFEGPQQQLAPSPTASSLGTYGGVDLKKSTGGIVKNISLFQLKQGTITYTPSIEYFSNGVRVNDWGGRLGIGWSDNFTALIQRTVRSVPDEYATQRLTTPVYQIVQNPTSTNYDIIETIEADGNLINGVGSFDGEYDVFSYNVFGVSGEFIIMNNQAVLLTHKQKIKIDILSTAPTFTFKITDEQGFKYYFQTEIEYTCMGVDEYITTSLPTAWFLNKIESPHDDELNFNYSTVSYACKTNFSQNFSYKYGQEPDDDISNPGDEYVYYAYGNSYNVSRRYTQTKCLTSVIGTDFRLTFTYGSRNDLIGDNLLSTIALYNGQNDVVSNVVFSYDTYIATTQPEGVLYEDDDLYSWNFGDIKTRYFLKTVTIGLSTSSNKQVYSFSYITPQNLPHRFSFSQDEGGFYNGISNIWFIPRTRVEEYVSQHPTLWNFPYTFTGNREPNYNASKVGILYQITYPTGGRDEIEYSPNTYIDWENEESYFPGLRVSSVTTYSLTSSPIVKNYLYNAFTKTDNQIILNDLPSSFTIDRGNAYVRRFYTSRQYEMTCLDIYYHNFYSDSRFNLNAFNGSQIAYSHVTETTGNSFVASIFNISSDELGSALYGEESFLNPKENTAWDNGLEINRYSGIRNTSDYWLVKEQAWNYENTLSLVTENCCVFKKYEAPGSCCCMGYVRYEPYTIISYNLWQNWYKLTSYNETLYDENSQNPITSTTNYYYDNATHGQITRIETIDSKGNSVKKLIKYPADINTGNYASMVSLNMINYPIEQTTLVDNEVTGSTLTTYKSGGGSYVPDKVYSVETTSPLSSFTYFNGTTKDSHYSSTAETEFVNYDSYGNMLESKGKDGVTTSYLWDSTGSYLMAQIRGATYSQVSSQNGKTASYNSATLWNSLNSLVSSAIIHTYSYLALVGMTSQTDPTGVTTYYEYDSSGRLILVKNDDEKLLNKYEYNYAHQCNGNVKLL